MSATDTVCPQSASSLDLVRAAAERGVAEAQLIYGQMLLDGNLAGRSPAAAFGWFECAAKGGNVMAMNMVGRCLDQGWGITESAALAAPWFRRAAESGLAWGMYNLATLLTLGRGVPEDKLEAFSWLRLAAEQRHAKSINLLAGFYEDGWVVARDVPRAIRLYRESAGLGDFRGQFNLARCCALAGDFALAAHWARRVSATATPQFLAKAKRFFEVELDDRMRSLAELFSVPATGKEGPC